MTPGGRIFATDTAHNRIFEFDQAGKVVQAFGTGLSGVSQLLVTGTGAAQRLYAVDTNHDSIKVYDLS